MSSSRVASIVLAVQWALRRGVLVAGIAIVMPQAASAQGSPSRQPRTAFTAADFAKLKWLEGTWQGSAPGESSFFERYEFANDSTIEITYATDSTLARPGGHGRIYLTMGRIYHTLGPGNWAATHLDENGVYFVPQANAHNTLAWAMVSPDSWTATSRTGVSGHDRVTVYQMRRTGKR